MYVEFQQSSNTGDFCHYIMLRMKRILTNESKLQVP
jgi:hypothetical protein